MTPYILFGLGLVVTLQTWLVVRSFQAETRFELLKQAFEFYVENAGKGAAVILNRPNPVPVNIQPLLRSHIEGKLKDPEQRQTLLDWARSVALSKEKDATQEQRDRRGVAFALVAAIGAVKRLPTDKRPKLWWRLW